MTPTPENVINALTPSRTGGSLSWHGIAEAIESQTIKIKNWMDVRMVIQSQIRTGFLRRQDNVHHEIHDALLRDTRQ